MQIQSPSTCISQGDVITVACENNRGRVQKRYYYIEQKTNLEGGAKYLAFRVKPEENGEYKLFTSPSSVDGPAPVILNQSIGKACRNTVTEKNTNPSLHPGTLMGIRRLLSTHDISQKFREAHASDKGPVIKCRNYGKLQVGAGEDRRRREFLESKGHHGNWRSPENADPHVTLGDVVQETGVQMSAAPPDDDPNTFEM